MTMPTRGKIEPIQKNWSDSHAHDPHSLWEKKKTPGALALPWQKLESLTVSDVQKSLPTREGQRVLIIGTQRCPTLIQELLAQLPPGLRVYVYLPQSLQNEPWVKALLKKQVVLRLGVEPPVDFLGIEEDQDGLLLLGPPGEPRVGALKPSPLQLRSLWRVAQYYFWFKANLEYLPGKNTLQTPLQAPFPAPRPGPLPLQAGTLYPDGAPADAFSSAEWVVSPRGWVPPIPPRKLLIPPDKLPLKAAKTLSEHGCGLFWRELALPRMAASRNEGTLLLEEGASCLSLKLTGSEAQVWWQLLEDVEQSPSWTYYPNRPLREVTNPIWQPPSAETVVRPHIALDYPPVQATQLADMPELKPKQWQTAPQLALDWQHRWSVLPPRVPRDAKRAQLVEQWEQLDNFVRVESEKLQKQLEQQKSSETSLFKRFTQLVKRWQPLYIKQRRIEENLLEVQEMPLSRRPSEAQRLLQQLQELQVQQQTMRKEAHQLEVAEEQREAQEAALKKFQEQQAADRQQQQQVQTKLAGVRAESSAGKTTYADLIAKKEALVKHIAEQEAAQRAAEQEAAQRAAEQEAAAAAMPSPARANTQKAARKKGNPSGKAKDKKSGPTNAKPEASTPLRKPSDPELVALESQLTSCEESLIRLQEQEKQLIQQLKQWNDKLDRPFQFSPPPARALPELPQLQPPPRVPTEAPPEQGQLFETASQRYLAVTEWEQVPLATQEANRLRAQLVTP